MKYSELSEEMKSIVPPRTSGVDLYAGARRKRNRGRAAGVAAVVGAVALAVPVALQLAPGQTANPVPANPDTPSPSAAVSTTAPAPTATVTVTATVAPTPTVAEWTPLTQEEILDTCSRGASGVDVDPAAVQAGTILTSAAVQDRTFAVVLVGETVFSCPMVKKQVGDVMSLPVTLGEDGLPTSLDPWSDYRVAVDNYSAGGTPSYFVGFGQLPADAAAIEFEGAAAGRAEVGEGGVYSYYLLAEAGSPDPQLSYTVLGAKGNVLFRGVAVGDGQPVREGDQ